MVRFLLTSSRIVTPTPRLLFSPVLTRPTLTHNHHDMLPFLRPGFLVLLLSFFLHLCVRATSSALTLHIFHSPYSFPYSISHTQATRAARSHHTIQHVQRITYTCATTNRLQCCLHNISRLSSFHILLESLGHSCYPSISTGNAGI